MKKTVLKVNINCHKCKTDVMKAVTKLMGVDEVAVNGDKGSVTVIGDVDPVLVVRQIKKTGKVVEIISVGPVKPQHQNGPHHDNGSDKHRQQQFPVCCRECQAVGVFSFAPPYYSIDDGGHSAGAFCSIL